MRQLTVLMVAALFAATVSDAALAQKPIGGGGCVQYPDGTVYCPPVPAPCHPGTFCPR